jgi:hypothetical protein
VVTEWWHCYLILGDFWVEISAQQSANLAEVVFGIPLSLQANAGILSKI